ncbi:hypothetical protein K2173_026681 [Erythroxylum novogranatense]|uniref:rRNA processing protein EBP2 n=1 Tax=Erythroxylum novogranatense TaxID=1862640 RepID=A0AAV8TZS6_9ROSI|nr:hypothetical protein K2173_026681 [Erythroxylum novogranatense]
MDEEQMQNNGVNDLREEEYESESETGEEDVKLAAPQANAVYNRDAINDKLQDIRKLEVNDDLVRELAFYTQALEGARKAFEQLESMGLPFLRPVDYYAEMVKSDVHMEKRSQRIAKKVQAQKLKERAMQKKMEIESVKKWRKTRQHTGFAGNEKDGEMDFAFEDGKVLERSSKKRPGVAPGDRSGGKTGQFRKKQMEKKQMKRDKRNSKFGFDRRKGLKKQNTAETTNEIRSFNKSGTAGNNKRKR